MKSILRSAGLWVIGGCLLAGVAWAAPFSLKFPFRQPDGTEIVLRGEGDEFYAVFEDADGYTVAFNQATKAYHYAQLSVDGTELLPHGPPVGKANPAALGLNKHVRVSRAARQQQVRERYQRWNDGMQVAQRWAARKQALRLADGAAVAADGGALPSPPASPTAGNKVGLTILVDFSDDVATIPQTNIVEFCNGTNYTGYSNNGSVRQYFSDNSNGLLTYTNVVTLYIRAPQPKTYYNDTTVDCGVEGRKLITDAINTMKALPNYTTDILPQFDALTVDGSSRVVACNVFFAGANSGVWSFGLWPHSWVLSSPLDLGNGKKVYYYQITNIGTALEIGTFCHENGHMLCDYPDIYDYDGDSIGGAGRFCLMNSGGHYGNPAQICAYLKRASGWATTVELNSNSVLLASVSSTGADFNKFYRYPKPGVATEYYLIENRQKAGRDSYWLPGGGVLIWHVDELGDRDNQSTNYNTTHLNYEVSLIQADNQWHFQRDINSGDIYDPYYSGNTAAGYSNRFNDTSTPSARWWDGSNSGLKLSAFSANGTTMTFQVGVPGVNIVQTGSSLTAESCLATNGAIDPGETVTLDIALQNVGTVNTTNLVATLLAVGGVTAPSGPQTYGALTAGVAAVSRLFTFTATGTCGGTLSAVFQLQDGPVSYGNLTNIITLGALSGTWSQNFDTASAPALPAGWTTAGSNSQPAWVTTTAQRDTLPNSAFSPDNSTPGVNELVSPAIAIASASAQLSFRHSYDTEATWDGGVLEIKIGGGAFTDIVTAGGSFVTGGYNSALQSSSNPLAGRSAWSGNSGGFITTTVNLPASAAGQTIQLRWRCGADDSVSGAGWWLDTITVSDRACCTGTSPVPDLCGAGTVLAGESCLATNGAIDPGETVAVEFAIQNIGTANTTNLIATLLATGGVTAPSGAQAYGTLTAGGATVSRLFTFTATGACGGTIQAILQLQDGPTDYGAITNTFTLGVVSSQSVTASKTTALTIPKTGAADVYPSTITINGFSASVSKVTVTLNNLSHNRSQDLDLLLVGPGGQKCLLMSDAGNGSVSGLTLTFDAAGTALPSTAITSGTYAPTNYDGNDGETDSFATNAPAGPYGTDLTVFNGVDPNGTWSLYIMDDQNPQTGSLAGGWQLNLTATTNSCCSSGEVPPVITGQPVAQAVCSGSPAGFSVTATGSNLAYQWQKNAVNLSNGSPYSGVTTANLNVSPADAGDYRCLVSNTGGSVTSSVATLTIKTATTVMGQPVSQGVCLGGTAQFSVTATGAGVLSYQWQKNSTNLVEAGHYSGVSSNVLTIANADNSDAASYRCIVTADCGSVNSSNATLTVSYPVLSVGPASLSFGNVATGTTVYSSFTVSNVGCGTLDVTAATGGAFWVNPTSFSIVAGNGTNVTVSFMPAGEGAFSTNVVFTSNGGSSTNSVAGNGAVAPVASFTAMPTSGQAPLNVTFTDTSTGTITNRFWQFGDGGTSNTTATSVLYTYGLPGSNTVRLLVSGPLGVSSNSALVVVLVMDSDNDGIPDVYENTHGLDAGDPTDAGKDGDGDGYTALQEYLAGTDPQDAGSALRIVTVTSSNGNFYVSFASETGKFYNVEHNTDLTVTNGWSAFTNNVPGNGGAVLVIDPGAAALPQQFYRVRLAP